MEEKLIKFEKEFLYPKESDDILDSRKTDRFEERKSNLHGDGLFVVNEVYVNYSYQLPLNIRNFLGSFCMNDSLYSHVLKLLDIKEESEIYNSTDKLNKFINLYLNHEIAREHFLCYLESGKIVITKNIEINTEIYRIYGIQYWIYYFFNKLLKQNLPFEEFKQHPLIEFIIQNNNISLFAFYFKQYCQKNIDVAGGNKEKLEYVGVISNNIYEPIQINYVDKYTNCFNTIVRICAILATLLTILIFIKVYNFI